MIHEISGLVDCQAENCELWLLRDAPTIEQKNRYEKKQGKNESDVA